VIQKPSNVKNGNGADGATDPEGREEAFWDEHVASLADCLAEYESGPDAHTRAALDTLEPLSGHRVLDFACGTGVASAWLAARGAKVLGLDISAQTIERARQLSGRLGLPIRFVSASLDSLGEDERFDRIFGRFALHHVDCAAVAPALARQLKPQGTAAFIETMDANPLLRLARRHLTGRFGIPRYGTIDEHPLTDADLEALRHAFGALHVDIPQMTFFRIADRQLLRQRSALASRLVGAIDDLLLDCGLGSWSYHQVLVLTRDGG
jgi:SAM-dependent methyltransferase